jgi:DNA polymerase III epsilon subunit-like protein
MSTLEMRQECQRLLNLRPMFLECKASSSGPQAEVVEIALIESDGSTLLDELVRPKRDIDPVMTKVHGISNEIAQHAVPWVEIWSQAKKLISGRLIGIFGLEAQVGWMRHSHTTGFLRWDSDPANFFCIQKLHAEYQNDWDRSTNNFRRFQLEEAAELVGLPSEPEALHRRALEDARLVRAILLVMAGWKVN